MSSMGLTDEEAARFMRIFILGLIGFVHGACILDIFTAWKKDGFLMTMRQLLIESVLVLLTYVGLVADCGRRFGL